MKKDGILFDMFDGHTVEPGDDVEDAIFVLAAFHAHFHVDQIDATGRRTLLFHIIGVDVCALLAQGLNDLSDVFAVGRGECHGDVSRSEPMLDEVDGFQTKQHQHCGRDRKDIHSGAAR